MKIELTKKQFENLLKLVYLGNWLTNAIRIENERIKKYDDIEQYIFSFAKEAGLEKYIEYVEDYDKFFPTKKLEENPEIMGLIDEYGEENFWDELIDKLSIRDFLEKYSETTIEKMEPIERMKKISACAQKYEEEFAKNGIENLVIK